MNRERKGNQSGASESVTRTNDSVPSKEDPSNYEEKMEKLLELNEMLLSGNKELLQSYKELKESKEKLLVFADGLMYSNRSLKEEVSDLKNEFSDLKQEHESYTKKMAEIQRVTFEGRIKTVIDTAVGSEYLVPRGVVFEGFDLNDQNIGDIVSFKNEFVDAVDAAVVKNCSGDHAEGAFMLWYACSLGTDAVIVTTGPPKATGDCWRHSCSDFTLEPLADEYIWEKMKSLKVFVKDFYAPEKFCVIWKGLRTALSFDPRKVSLRNDTEIRLMVLNIVNLCMDNLPGCEDELSFNIDRCFKNKITGAEDAQIDITVTCKDEVLLSLITKYKGLDQFLIGGTNNLDISNPNLREIVQECAFYMEATGSLHTLVTDYKTTIWLRLKKPQETDEGQSSKLGFRPRVKKAEAGPLVLQYSVIKDTDNGVSLQAVISAVLDQQYKAVVSMPQYLGEMGRADSIKEVMHQGLLRFFTTPLVDPNQKPYAA